MSRTTVKADLSIEVEADLLDQSELDAVKRSAEVLLTRIAKCESVEGGWDICDAVWPAYKMQSENTKPRLILMPLSRLGAAQGFSGSHVMVGYFVDSGETGLFPSRPMILKLLKQVEESVSDLLQLEMSNAESVKIFIAYHRDCFAVPLHFDSFAGFSLLWSPFSSNKWTFEAYQQSKGSRLSLAIDDLLGHLRSTNDDKATEEIIRTVYRLLMPLHLAAGTARLRNQQLVTEYQGYLRNIENDGWGNEWRENVWAPANQATTFDLNRDWANPFWVLAGLRRSAPTSLFYGAVHGDLHPRNIVLSDNNAPHVIDFGWTTNGAHIAKDFVLLESNLRFVALNPSVPYQGMETMAAWVGFNSSFGDFGNDYCDRRARLIQQVREMAKSRFPDDTNWDNEYIIPLFLVSLGLLKHLRDCDNQLAARFTVLSLANYITQNRLLER